MITPAKAEAALERAMVDVAEWPRREQSGDLIKEGRTRKSVTWEFKEGLEREGTLSSQCPGGQVTNLRAEVRGQDLEDHDGRTLEQGTQTETDEVDMCEWEGGRDHLDSPGSAGRDCQGQGLKDQGDS